MKHFIRTTCVAMASMVIFASCKKDDDKSRTELLTQSNWKLVSDQEKAGSAPWEEYIDDYDPCELDNYFKFNTNGSVVLDEGPTKCDPTDPQTETGNWSFESNESRLNLDGYVVDIEELNGSTLTFTSTETFGGVTYIYKQIYRH